MHTVTKFVAKYSSNANDIQIQLTQTSYELSFLSICLVSPWFESIIAAVAKLLQIIFPFLTTLTHDPLGNTHRMRTKYSN